MDRERRLLRFVVSLAEAVPPVHFRNPYVDPQAAANLLLFLTRRETFARNVLLIGEAPGYRGAALSGVALASLATLIDQWDDPWQTFGPESGYTIPRGSVRRREATATIVWNCLADVFGDAPLPLTWNSVPFHPRGDSLESNAPLARRDVEVGRPWLEEILELFPDAVPVAVGVRACDALCELSLPHTKVRHPSRGGRREFEQGLRQLSTTI
jgi:hypothetical protein